MKKLATIVLIVFVSCTANQKRNKRGLVVFAAASLAPALQEIAKQFETAENIGLKINYASSGTLARQIEMGAKCDAYFSANIGWMDYLKKKGVLVPGSREELIENKLVIIGQKNNTIDTINFDNIPEFLLNPEIKFSIGDPSHVPVGKYARQAMENLGWYNSIKAKIVFAKDARSAFYYVELGEIPYGVVYQTDARGSQKIKVLGTFPQQSHGRIIISMAFIGDSLNSSLTRFRQFIRSEKVKNIWREYGYIIKSRN
ncbi:Molybdenum ABC transporter, substrate-binding protein ModA [hydrothermal vent metagenome]|uniref:Molybdenum ABC transporter, substrate-binding protein ModA n=1 Tax=hydrothermal vent metagenome TaxID=652676 RepID=A0A3B0UQ63_9ZZZZ